MRSVYIVSGVITLKSLSGTKLVPFIEALVTSPLKAFSEVNSYQASKCKINIPLRV